jgi:phosphohistidine phosphatase SixA
MQKVAPFLLAGLAFLPMAAIAQETTLKPQAVLEALRQGGHIILIRHAASDSNQKDAANVNLADCNTQRNLSRKGRMDARMMGQEIDNLQIPVGKVLSSPYCRAMDTARLAFARAEGSEALSYVKDTDADKRKAANQMRPLLSTAPLPQTNTVLISHSTNILGTIGFVPEEGEAVVFKPDGKGSYMLMGRIPPKEWSALKP